MVHWTAPSPEASALPLLAAGLGAAAALARAVGADLGGRLAVISVCAAGSQATPRFWGDREPEPALLVLEEEALAMPSRQAAAQGCRLGHGEDRRMAIGPMRDPERIETGEKLFRGQRPHHDSRTMRALGRQRKPCKPGLAG